jgi:hypothetical protein
MVCTRVCVCVCVCVCPQARFAGREQSLACTLAAVVTVDSCCGVCVCVCNTGMAKLSGDCSALQVVSAHVTLQQKRGGKLDLP